MRLKILIFLSAVMFSAAFVSCGNKSEYKFNAVVDSINGQTLTVISADDKKFDNAAVSITGKTQILPINAVIKSGDFVTVTYTGAVRESYPVQITAVKIEVISANSKLKTSSAATGEYVKISPQEAKKLIDSEQNLIILDVRTTEEYSEKHIKNSILIPDYELEEQSAEKLQDKDRLILVYCRSGRRSEASAKLLVKLGYKNVKDFGGIIDWPYETVSE